MINTDETSLKVSASVHNPLVWFHFFIKKFSVRLLSVLRDWVLSIEFEPVVSLSKRPTILLSTGWLLERTRALFYKPTKYIEGLMVDWGFVNIAPLLK